MTDVHSTTISHQTVRLARGAHRVPGRGVCVMELASMLAGEPFSDRPRTACPVIAALLRTYNDACDETRRQDLFPYASAVVGTRATRRLERARARRAVEWASERSIEGGEPSWWSRHPGLLSWGPAARKIFRMRFAHAIGRPDDRQHRQVLELFDELIGIGAPRQVEAPPVEEVTHAVV